MALARNRQRARARFIGGSAPTGGPVFDGNQPGAVRAFAPYTYVPLTTGGTPPLTFSLTGSLPDGFSFDPGTGTIFASGPAPGALLTGATMGVTDNNGLSDSLPLTDMTQAPSIIPVSSVGTAYTASPAGFAPNYVRRQIIYSGYIRVNVAPGTSRSIFSVGNQATPRQFFSVIAADATQIEMRLGSGTTSRTFAPNQVGQYLHIVVQYTYATTAPRDTIDERCRVWINGVRQALPGSFAAVANPGDTNQHFITLNHTGTSVVNNNHAYHWFWEGDIGEMGLVDFDNPANIALFDPLTLDATTGTVTFVGSGGTGTLSPRYFYHGRATGYNGTLVNLGTLGSVGNLTNITTGYTETDYTSEVLLAGDPAVVSRSTMRQGNVQWTLSASAPVYEFADESYGVDITTPVNLVSVSPASVQSDRPWKDEPGTSGLSWINGTMHNAADDAKLADSGNTPPPGIGVDGSGAKHGFDQGPVPRLNFQTLQYTDAYNRDPGRIGAPVSLLAGGWIKAISDPTVFYGTGTSDNATNITSEMRALYAYAGTPPTAAPDLYFRPGFTGRAPLIWTKANNADLDISMFPSLSTAGLQGVPSFFSIYTPISKFQASVFTLNHSTSENIEYENNYGSNHCNMTAQAALLMCLSTTTSDQKYAMARAFGQYGHDLCDFTDGGTAEGDVSGAGATSFGRKLALAIAALVTGSTRLEDRLAASNANGRVWREDSQIKLITPAMVTANTPSILDGRGGGGGGQWTANNSVGNEGSVDWGVAYRHIWGCSSTGTNNLLHAVTGLAALWGNDLFRNYMDFYWAYEASRTPTAFPGESSSRLSVTTGPLAFFRTFRQVHGGAWSPVGPLGPYV